MPQSTPQDAPQILGLYDPHAATARIQDLRRQGLSLTRIAAMLTQEGIPTRYGLPWQYRVVYLGAAGNSDGPVQSRSCRVNQPALASPSRAHRAW